MDKYIDENPSPSSRRAWIEIVLLTSSSSRRRVALLAEGVDRNFWFFAALFKASKVALLAEGVDRNCFVHQLRGE